MGPSLVVFIGLGGALIAGLAGWRSRRLCELLSVAFSALAASLSLFYLVAGWRGAEWLAKPYLVFYSDPLALFMLAVVNVLGAVIVLYSVGYMARERDYVRYYFLILAFIGSMSGLVLAGDVVLLYIFWEAVGICSALLIAYWWEKPAARRAGLKAFTVTRVGDFAMLFAIALLAFQAHMTNIESIVSASLPARLAQTVALLLLVGALAKSAQFPLYVWLPDAMEGPTSVSALIHAATMVKAGVYLVSRFYPVMEAGGALQPLFWAAAATLIISGISALGADDVKKVLAYSTINHLAIMFAALALGGWVYAQLHLLSHSLFKALLFLCAGLIVHEAGTRKLDELGGLWRGGLRITGAAFLIGSASLAGIPPFPGFTTKEAVLSLLEEKMPLLGPPLAFTVSLLSALYIFRLFLRLFTGEPRRSYREHDPWMLTPIVILAAATAAGAALLPATASLFHSHIQLFEATPLALLGTVIGLAAAWLVWGRGHGAGLRRSLLPAARVADKGFLLDDAYTWLARQAVRAGSFLSTRLQTGVPSINVAVLASFLLLLLLYLAGVI